jgi:hypothetical protein
MDGTGGKVNLEVLFDMLNSSDSNFAYFAASKAANLARLLSLQG